MRKIIRTLATGILATGAVAAMALCGHADEASYKVGVSLTTITDPVFADFAQKFPAACEERGWECTLVSSEQDASAQLTQVENMITAGIDALIIYPPDEATFEDILGQAQEKGIKVLTWDFELQNANMSWLVKNYDLGLLIGQQAGEWINEHYDGECEVAVLDYALLPVIVERANGILDGIAQTAPKAKVVAQDSAVTTDVGLTVSENMLQAHPDIKVFACIGDGGGLGANEALKSKGANLEEYGIFCADASKQALASMQNHEAIRMTVSLGKPKDWCVTLTDAIETMMTSDNYEKQLYKVEYPVTEENLEEYMAE